MRNRHSLATVILALLCFLSARPATAQTASVTGLVRSAETSAPLIAAVVQVVAPDGGRVSASLTDQAGRYLISGIPPGTYTLTVSMTGYRTGRVESLPVAGGETASADFDLFVRAIDLDPVVVSASRRQERALDAPARTEVVTEHEIRVRPALTPVDHLRVVPGVDVATHGLQSTNVVTRGFNNIFSGALYTLTDHRMAGVPSLRVNLMHLIPATDDDIERMEVVLGPGSALYGPYTSNGVLHILTKSPLVEQTTTASIAGGERSVFMGGFRTAHLVNQNLGVKVSGQYMRGDEWPHDDPVEAQARAIAETIDPDTRIGRRDLSIERWSGEARADWRVTPDLTAILSVGRTNAVNGIELTGIGAAQIQNWSYTYYQTRLNWNRFFAQAYVNASDAGETFTLRDGRPLTDRSRLFVAQAQHGVTVRDRQNFTYGLDFVRTLPETERTIHGRYEEIDRYSEFGGYLQSETAVTERLDLVLAGRFDTHTELENTVFSPRAAIVFKPAMNHTLRASYNRAFSTPRALDIFLDIPAGPFPDAALAGLGYRVRAMGPGRDGFRFRTPDGGLTGMRSPFTPAAMGGPAELLPATTQMMWAIAVGILQAQGVITPQQAQSPIFQPPTSAQVGIMGLDVLAHTEPVPIANVGIAEFDRLQESNTTTYEVGYKALLGERLLIATDVWYAVRDNFISALRPVTPLLFLNGQQIAAVLIQRGMPQAQAVQIAGAIGPIPLGVVSSDAVSAEAAEFLVTYRNFGEIDLWGSDISAQFLLTEEWSVSAMTSLVNRHNFRSEGELITLNAPKTKIAGRVVYRSERTGLNGETRVRHNSAFPVLSAPFVATACLGETGRLVEPCVESFTLVDLVLGYRLPQLRGAALQLAVQNVLDTGYRSFPGVPEIGRMAMLRLRYDF
jgi:outer membrane receptor for ferrienterochelin and colicins